jgi:hypothetical protein
VRSQAHAKVEPWRSKSRRLSRKSNLPIGFIHQSEIKAPRRVCQKVAGGGASRRLSRRSVCAEAEATPPEPIQTNLRTLKGCQSPSVKSTEYHSPAKSSPFPRKYLFTAPPRQASPSGLKRAQASPSGRFPPSCRADWPTCNGYARAEAPRAGRECMALHIGHIRPMRPILFPNSKFEVGCWMLDVGCWMLDVHAHPLPPPHYPEIAGYSRK